MNIHFKTEVSTVRAYGTGETYECRSPTVFSCTLHYISDTEAYICNAVGDGGRKVFKELAKKLTQEGILVLKYERKGILKTLNITRYT